MVLGPRASPRSSALERAGQWAAALQLLPAMTALRLQPNTTVKLHIAGHIQTDEDPKLSSQRAQAVGAALIALGAMPSRLRAKGVV